MKRYLAPKDAQAHLAPSQRAAEVISEIHENKRSVLSGLTALRSLIH